MCAGPWTGSRRSATPWGGGEAVIPDALLYYQRHHTDGASGADGAHRTTGADGADGASDMEGPRGGVMLRAFVEVDRATMGPERLAAKLTAYARLHRYAPAPAAAALPRTDARKLAPALPALPSAAVRP